MSLGGVGLVFEIFCLPMLLVEPTLAFELDDGTFFFLASFSSSLKTSNISFGDSSMILSGDCMTSITHIGFALAAAAVALDVCIPTFLFLPRFGEEFRFDDRKLTLTMILSPEAKTSLSAISEET